MTQIREVYRCEICGNLVESVGSGSGTMVCCGQPMTLLKENAVDASPEKHVPVIQKNGNTIHVQVGSTIHPMVQNHYIGWIEVLQNDKIQRKELKPGDQPMADFEIDNGPFSVRAWCNLHGLWKNN